MPPPHGEPLGEIQEKLPMCVSVSPTLLRRRWSPSHFLQCCRDAELTSPRARAGRQADLSPGCCVSCPAHEALSGARVVLARVPEAPLSSQAAAAGNFHRILPVISISPRFALSEKHTLFRRGQDGRRELLTPPRVRAASASPQGRAPLGFFPLQNVLPGFFVFVHADLPAPPAFP